MLVKRHFQVDHVYDNIIRSPISSVWWTKTPLAVCIMRNGVEHLGWMRRRESLEKEGLLCLIPLRRVVLLRRSVQANKAQDGLPLTRRNSRSLPQRLTGSTPIPQIAANIPAAERAQEIPSPASPVKMKRTSSSLKRLYTPHSLISVSDNRFRGIL